LIINYMPDSIGNMGKCGARPASPCWESQITAEGHYEQT
jgi:hypothetical protein